MKIKNNIPLESLLVTLPATLHDALEAIDNNTLGIVFLVDADRKLIGVLTDGDARRALLAGADLSNLITDNSIFNRSPHYLPFDSEISEIWNLFEQNLRCIPLLDATHRVVDYSIRARVRHLSVLESDIVGQ